MFERMFVPLDGSRLAERVLPQVVRIARQTNAEVILFQAYTPSPKPAFEYVPVATYGQVEADEYVERKAADLKLLGLQARGLARMGSAAGTILDVAKEERASLIALGTHGRSGLSRWALGSVAEKVLRASPIPVLTFRSYPGSPAVDAGRPLRNILLPLDGSDRAKAIVPYVAEIAKAFSARVVALHVLEPGEDRHAASEAIQAVTARLVSEGAEGVMLVREGDPASEILETCTDQQVDLVAMTTHGRSGPTRWIFGSVTEKVMRGASTPMLVVRNSANAKAPIVGAVEEGAAAR